MLGVSLGFKFKYKYVLHFRYLINLSAAWIVLFRYVLLLAIGIFFIMNLGFSQCWELVSRQDLLTNFEIVLNTFYETNF